MWGNCVGRMYLFLNPEQAQEFKFHRFESYTGNIGENLPEIIFKILARRESIHK